MRRIFLVQSNILFFAIVLGIFLIPQDVHALTISPVRFELKGDAGQILLGELELYNDEKETKILYSSSQNFEARGESGTPYFLSNTNEGLASWISINEHETLEPGVRKKVPFRIQIPSNTPAGGYFAAIFWGTSPPQSGGAGEVSISGKLGVLLLLSVGDAEEKGGLIEFEKTEKIIYSLPVSFFYRFSNDGSERVNPQGSLVIKNMFGRTRATIDANITQGNVLPRSIRKFDVVWYQNKQNDFNGEKYSLDVVSKKQSVGFLETLFGQWNNFALGPYTGELALTYGGGKTVNEKINFFVFPWHLLSVLAAIALFVLWFMTKGIRIYNKWLIGRALKDMRNG
jgi:hypothetical protein